MKISNLIPFKDEMTPQLCRWIKNEKELVCWSGSTFYGKSFSARALQIHLQNINILPFTTFDNNGALLTYGEIVKKDHNRLSLCRIIVNPCNRGMGIGKLFCHLLLKKCESFGVYKNVRLNVLKKNKPAIRCYLSLGFRQIGEIPNARKIESEEVDLIIMTKSLNVIV